MLAGSHSKAKAVPPPPPPQAAAETSPAAAKAGAVRRKHYRRFRPHEEALAALILKPARQRFTDLLGSMLLGSLVAVTMCLVMVIVAALRGDIPRPEQCAWLLLVGIAGAWAVMIPSKFWEGTKGETLLRRFVLMVVGLGLGAFAWAASTWLMVQLPHDTEFPLMHDIRLPANFYDGGPLLLAYVAVFGTLMATLRWWTQADPLRASRLSLWSLFTTSVMAGLVAWVWRFPQPWLVMVACTMSVSIQLASPWLPLKKRQLPRPD